MTFFDSRNILKIPRTVGLLADCWNEAEKNLQAEIRANAPDLDEECITRFFHVKLAQELRIASERRSFEEEFLADLKAAFSELGYIPELTKISRGLIADVTLHGLTTETKTGGDFGFVVARPQIEYCSKKFLVTDYRRGMLCQAKLRRANDKWGELTDNQKSVLTKRLQYLALLLYSYGDKDRRLLNQFRWQLCQNANSIQTVADWLRLGGFPSTISSGNVITQIGNGMIGTDNDERLDELVVPPGNVSLIINIRWPDDDHPGEEICVLSNRHETEKTIISITC